MPFCLYNLPVENLAHLTCGISRSLHASTAECTHMMQFDLFFCSENLLPIHRWIQRMDQS